MLYMSKSIRELPPTEHKRKVDATAVVPFSFGVAAAVVFTCPHELGRIRLQELGRTPNFSIGQNSSSRDTWEKQDRRTRSKPPFSTETHVLF